MSMHLQTYKFNLSYTRVLPRLDDPINQPRRRIVTSSVRQDDDNTITLEATQDMLFMSNEGLPSEGDIAQMTQVGTWNCVCLSVCVLLIVL